LRQLATQFLVISLCYGRNAVRVRILIWVKNNDKYICAVNAHLHNTIVISCTIILFNPYLRDWVRVRFWRMKTTADATISVHKFMAKFKMCPLYTHLFEYIRQGKNRIRLTVSCRWAFNITILG
jgi:hypothetical protein